MKITPKLRKKLYEGFIITDEAQFSYYRTNNGQWYRDSIANGDDVVKIPATWVPAWVLEDYLDFKKTQDMKTKKIIGISLIILFLVGFALIINYVTGIWWAALVSYALTTIMIGFSFLIVWLFED